jgi:osmoprotectant transport system ATP-binding protein
MIQLNNIYKTYSTQKAVDDVSLTIETGECVVLIGPSGSGKSTLLKSINRMVAVDSGSIAIDGQLVTAFKPELLRRQIGYCIQGVGLFPHLTVRENIEVVPRLLNWDQERLTQRVNLLMDLSELPLPFLSKKPHELSGGEAQRVGVCRALAADPPILLMDEPFGAVDPLTRERLQAGFNRIQQEFKKTVVFVTHDVEEAIVLGDRIAVMQAGKIVKCSHPGGFVEPEQPAFIQSFLGADYSLRLLKRYTVEALMKGEMTLTHDGTTEQSRVYSADSNLKELLAAMISSKERGLTVALKDGGVVHVHYAELTQFLEEVQHGNT